MRQYTRRNALRLGATVAAGIATPREWFGGNEARAAVQIAPPPVVIQPDSVEVFDADNRLRFMAPPSLLIPDAVRSSELGEFSITAVSFDTGTARFLTIRRTTVEIPGEVTEADWQAAKLAYFSRGVTRIPATVPEPQTAGGFAGFVGLVDAETPGGNPYREAIWVGGRDAERVMLTLNAAQLRVRGVRAMHDAGAADLAQILGTLDLDAR